MRTHLRCAGACRILIATLEPLGITGVNYIQISAGTVSKPLLKDTVPSNVVPVIRTKRRAPWKACCKAAATC